MPTSHGRPKKQKRTHPHRTTEVDRYVASLLAAALPEREAARAGLFAQEMGFDAMVPGADGCVVFDEPSCGNWNCLSPGHQRFVP